MPVDTLVPLLDVSPDDIAKIDDDDLRTLIALLCEAELGRQDFSAVGVTWGGNQNARDGGLDIHVNEPKLIAAAGYIPRAHVGFQVKVPDMQPAGITKEMRPGGSLRPSIAALASDGGAYIIVSSTTSASDSMLADRVTAMRDALSDCPDAEKMHVDFYDRTRIASWVRSHSGLIPRARIMAGRPMAGWQSFGPWANPAETSDGEFLVDNEERLHRRGGANDHDLTIQDGINLIRDELRTPRRAVRLVGLSGTGKTRLVQALFDERVGIKALAPTLALYADMGADPAPSPLEIVTTLLAHGEAAIVIVDNCPSALHRDLAKLIAGRSSRASILTVEYDIRDDLPENTEVFKLDPATGDILPKLLRERCDGLLHVDASRIAHLSGGNFRMALALARTFERGDSTSGLRDAQIFERLFWQRNQKDPALERAAKACALLYSFDFEHTDPDSELARLADLAEMSVRELRRHVVELQRRDLVQARSIWRAVLPHALANRLARDALQEIPRSDLLRLLVQTASDRVQQSFSRRLRYLHGVPEAQEIAAGWMQPGGWLDGNAALDWGRRHIFFNVALLCPVATLGVLTDFAKTQEGVGRLAGDHQIASLIGALAWDAALFGAAVELLVMLALEDLPAGKKGNPDTLRRLFRIYGSGTHAPLQIRLEAVEGLLASDEPDRRSLGQKLLAEMLGRPQAGMGTWLEFGGQLPDIGYQPASAEEIDDWYSGALGLAEKLLVKSERRIGADIAHAISLELPNFSQRDGAYSAALSFIDAAIKRGIGHKLWIEFRKYFRWVNNAEKADVRALLLECECTLRPRTLADRVRALVLSKDWLFEKIDFDDIKPEVATPETDDYKLNDSLVRALATSTASEPDVLCALLPELHEGTGRYVGLFGEALAAATNAPLDLWDLALDSLAQVPEAHRTHALLGGMITGITARRPDMADQLLDQAITHPLLATVFPYLQCLVPIDAKGIARLRESLGQGRARIVLFRPLTFSSHERFSASDLRELLVDLAKTAEGRKICLQVLAQRAREHVSRERQMERELLDFGKSCLAGLSPDELTPLSRHHDSSSDVEEIRYIIKACLTDCDTEARELAQHLLVCLRTASAGRDMYILYSALCDVAPLAALDELFTHSDAKSEAETNAARADLLIAWSEEDDTPFASLPAEVVLPWCAAEPDWRYVAVAKVIVFSQAEDGDSQLQWTPLARALINRAPTPHPVILRFIERFRPRGWSGSLAAIMERYVPLLEDLSTDTRADIAAFARGEQTEFCREIERERVLDLKRSRLRDESFE